MLEKGGRVLITADHGNADKMLDTDGSTFTAHTTNLVPLILVGDDKELKPGRLCDLAPTMLELMGIEKPVEISCVSNKSMAAVCVLFLFFL